MTTLFREASSGRMALSTGMFTAPTGCLARAGRRALSTTPACHARLIARPQRPYQFTQMVQLSDGSTFTMRSTSPHALHRSTKDSRNHILWQPTEKSLRNVEVDEAGRLAAFRNRFGRGWDASQDVSEEAAEPELQNKTAGSTEDAASASASAADPGQTAVVDPFDSLADLLSGYAAKEDPAKHGGLSAKEQARKDKKKK
ncbi:50S ribosomal protein [Grosmannia clavigera kw1407]|uniref:50S ribosomal protein n=1 Tax=Grosmannia clavigera (strain kw1407 / UAMH 11150) TaxID=655863 RepID=F0XMF2_GROCL|nr:50S ribosomal protein [Grosmannia clavigera kw1407]EFX01458.1 50S ribosomal protein [Grosmannia clavigera kw1407]